MIKIFCCFLEFENKIEEKYLIADEGNTTNMDLKIFSPQENISDLNFTKIFDGKIIFVFFSKIFSYWIKSQRN